MSKALRNRLLVIFGVIAGCILFVFPIEKRINLGLDLRGGMHMILKVEADKLPVKQQEDAVLRAIEILRTRIDSMGVGETVVQRQGQYEILVQLPGVTDREKAVDMVKRVAHLEFRLVHKDTTKLQEALKGTVPEGYVLKYTKGDDSEPVLIENKASMLGESISDARVDFDQTGIAPSISISFNDKGAQEFATLTQAHVGDKLAIVLDGEVLSAPNIKEAIMGGKAEITGQFTYDEASLLALALRSGSLPVPITIEEERTIGPLLGMDSIEAGKNATIIGAALVFVFMILYYLVGGVVASIALLLNLGMTLGIMGFLNVMLPGSQVTLTLPGIAGLALTLGMAVDANVLINERIREELDVGKPLASAVNAGYDRAFSAIIDSNLTTLIAAFMLFQFGSGPIKGFAVTLTMGLVASLFTSVYVTRTIFMYLLEKSIIKNLPMMHIIKATKFDFIGKAPIFLFISAAIIVYGFWSVAQKKSEAFGIDFSGGQIQEYRTDRVVSADEIRDTLKASDIKDAVIQESEKDGKQNIMIRTPKETDQQVQSALGQKFGQGVFEIMRIEKVGPVVGKQLRSHALWAMLLALAGIMIYVAFRFKHVDFAVAGVVALLHDVAVAMGLTVVFGRQIDLLVVTALMTIAGYSINDTIVIYDRVRENFTKAGGGKKASMADIINLSINQTLGRTILTSFATMLTVVSFYFLGGEVLNTFALTLIIGMIAGVYSTVYIVSPLVVWINKMQKKSW